MLPDRISNPGPLTYESGALPIALRGPAYPGWKVDFTILIEQRKIPSAEGIHYLQKYLGGTAKEAVENVFLVSFDYAYDLAKNCWMSISVMLLLLVMPLGTS